MDGIKVQLNKRDRKLRPESFLHIIFKRIFFLKNVFEELLVTDFIVRETEETEKKLRVVLIWK